MVTITKFYHDPEGHIKEVQAIIYWKPAFMEYLVRKFGFYNTFTMEEVENFFEYYTTKNAVRHRILRLYKAGWLKRELKEISERGFKRKLYNYGFTEKSKTYYFYWGSFESKKAPLTRKIPCNACD